MIFISNFFDDFVKKEFKRQTIVFKNFDKINIIAKTKKGL